MIKMILFFISINYKTNSLNNSRPEQDRAILRALFYRQFLPKNRLKHFPRPHSQPLRSCEQLVAHWCACMLHCMALVGHVWHPTPPTLAIDPPRAHQHLGGGLGLVGGCPVATRAPGLIQSRNGLSCWINFQ